MCPWITWQQPGIRFCEAIVCGWVRQPINAYSNIAFIMAGVWIFMQLKKGWSPLHLFALASIMIGITSFLFHASMTFFFQFFDVSSMNMLILICTSFNMGRLKIISDKQMTIVYLGLLALSMVLMYILQGKSGEYIFTFWVLATAGSELYLKSKGQVSQYKYFYLACGTLALAFTIWVGDVKGWWCDPDNHYFQGHAIWHVMNAFAIVFLYKFFKQFYPNAVKNKLN